MTQPQPDTTAQHRRSFLRQSTGAALSVLAAGAATVLNASPASASYGTCCGLAYEPTPWCNYYCVESGYVLTSWGCNNMTCLCYECFLIRSRLGASCWGAYAFNIGCSNSLGCCANSVGADRPAPAAVLAALRTAGGLEDLAVSARRPGLSNAIGGGSGASARAR